MKAFDLSLVDLLAEQARRGSLLGLGVKNWTRVKVTSLKEKRDRRLEFNGGGGGCGGGVGGGFPLLAPLKLLSPNQRRTIYHRPRRRRGRQGSFSRENKKDAA